MGSPGSEGKRRGPRVVKWELSDVPLLPVPKVNVACLILDKLKPYAHHRNALIDASTKESRDYQEILEGVPRVAGGLARAGVQVGDKVLYMAPSHPDFPLVMLATLYLGAVFVPITPTFSPEEIARAATLVEARWMVVHEEVAARVEEARARHLPPGTLRQVWLLGRQHHQPCLAHLLQASPIQPYDVGEAADRSPATIFFSSGTTGMPKGVMLSHTSMVAIFVSNSYMVKLMVSEDLTEADIQGMIEQVYSSMLLMLPLHHVYGQCMLILCLCAGGTTILLPSFTPRGFLSAIQDYQVKLLPLVPHIAEFMAKSPLVDEYDLSSLTALFSSSAPLSQATTDAVTGRIGDIKNGYGMTEFLNITGSNGILGSVQGSVGQVMPYTQLKVVEVGTGRLLAEGEEGEVLVRGPTMMIGYCNNPEATANTIDPDGWLHTGDLGYYNAENHLFLTGRSKDLIKVKGFQVAPVELEEILMEEESLLEVAVVGVPHPRTGEAPRAFVVLKPGATIIPEDLQRRVAERVSAPYKQLTGGVEVVDELPRNATGKVLRRKLKERSQATSRSKL